MKLQRKLRQLVAKGFQIFDKSRVDAFHQRQVGPIFEFLRLSFSRWTVAQSTCVHHQMPQCNWPLRIFQSACSQDLHVFESRDVLVNWVVQGQFSLLPERHQGDGGDGFGHRMTSEQTPRRHLRGELLVLVAADIDINQTIVFDSTFCNSRHVAHGNLSSIGGRVILQSLFVKSHRFWVTRWKIGQSHFFGHSLWNAGEQF
mmetsp:Transcript_62347/g.98648  ORF Transcript_62347/g.98648 Transcript_62347/m.98648 type:complete len:201 (+) Transcript_62347:825-1427(+)